MLYLQNCRLCFATVVCLSTCWALDVCLCFLGGLLKNFWFLLPWMMLVSFLQLF